MPPFARISIPFVLILVSLCGRGRVNPWRRRSEWERRSKGWEERPRIVAKEGLYRAACLSFFLATFCWGWLHFQMKFRLILIKGRSVFDARLCKEEQQEREKVNDSIFPRGQHRSGRCGWSIKSKEEIDWLDGTPVFQTNFICSTWVEREGQEK